MNAALYKRVSTLEQANEGYSLEAQQERLEGYAKYQGYNIVDSYTDDGYSASSLNRPALQRLISDIKQHKIDIVIIYKLDRLSRKVKDVLELVELFQQSNVTLFSLTENLDLSSPFGRAALKMSATFSELERENIIERTVMGKDQRGKSGYMMANKTSPFGYDYDKETKRFNVNEEEAEIVRKIFELYVNEGYSLRKLNDYCAAHYNHSRFNNPMSCKPIIHRPMYAGYYSYKGELIKGKNFEPIISMETYLKAQKCSQEHNTKRNIPNTPYLLTGLMYCAECGNRYTGKTRKHYVTENGKRTLKYEYKSYLCAARGKRDAKYTPAKCNNIILDAKEIEDKVVGYVKNLEFTGYKSEKVMTNLIDHLLVENADLGEKKRKLLDLYIENIIDKDTFTGKSHEIDKKIEQNNRILDTEKNKIEELPVVAIDYLKDKVERFDKLSMPEQRKVLDLLIDKIIINNKDVIIKWRVK